MHPAWHKIVAGSLGCGLGEHRGFDVKETLHVQKTPHRHCNLIAQPQIFLHLWSAQIQVTIFKPHHLGEIFIIHLEWRRRRGVQNFNRSSKHLDFSRYQVGVNCPGRAWTHQTRHFNNELVAYLFGSAKSFCIIGVAYDLDQAFAVTKVDKYDPTVVAPTMDPTIKSNRLAQMAGADQPTVFSTHSLRITFVFEMLLKGPLRPANVSCSTLRSDYAHRNDVLQCLVHIHVE